MPRKSRRSAKTTPRRLSARDRRIIDHVVRYRIGVMETMHRLFFADQELGAVCKVVQRLCDEEWLRRYPLIYPMKYFVPGKRTAQAFGLPIGRTHPLGPQSLPTEYAVLLYATQATGLLRLHSDEIQQRFDWYDASWTLAPHCLRSVKSQPILELLRIDLGGPADYVARKCLADIQLRQQRREFEDFVKRELFRLVVISATTEKAAAIQQALHGHLWPAGLRIHLAVIPELLPLLPRCSDAT